LSLKALSAIAIYTEQTRIEDLETKLRCDAIAQKIFIKTELGINLPIIFISTTAVPILYSDNQQIKDMKKFLSGLDNDPSVSTDFTGISHINREGLRKYCGDMDISF
jgi:hypothetical protein